MPQSRAALRLSQEDSVTLPQKPHYACVEAMEKRYESFESLQNCLDCHYLAMSVPINVSDFAVTLAWQYYENAHRDGVHHAEVLVT